MENTGSVHLRELIDANRDYFFKGKLSGFTFKKTHTPEPASTVDTVRSGFQNLDTLLGGFNPGELALIAGRPLMGKGSLMLNFANYIAIKEEVPVLYFSLKMPGEELAKIIIKQLSKVSLFKMRTAKLSDQDFKNLETSMNEIDKAPYFINNSKGIKVTDIYYETEKMFAGKKDTGIVFIDGFKLIQSSLIKNTPKELAKILTNLKNLARELNIVVILSIDLYRTVETKASKRPELADLKEIVPNPETADIIMLIYRESFYFPDTENQMIAELDICKNKNDPPGKVLLKVSPSVSNFGEYNIDILY